MAAMSRTRNLYEMMEFPSEGVFSTVVARGDMSNHTLMCLADGTDITEHTSTREALVTVAKPQRNCAAKIKTYKNCLSPEFTCSSIAQKKTFQPWLAASSMLGSIRTNEQSMIQPAKPDQKTEEIIPAGTECAAFTVSSEVCADASYPVIV